MYIDLHLPEEMKEIISRSVEKEMREWLQQDPIELKRLVKETVKGQFKARLNEILQSNDCRNFMSEKIWQVLKGKE